jgi:RimJ/RimL family protein N-acetyltransferase
MLEVGWLVAPERQREGIATEAGRASLEWCFQHLGVDRVCSLIVPDNLASARVATKLGARIESRVDALFAVPVDVWVHRRPAAM